LPEIAASTIPCRQKPSFLPAAQSSGVLDSAEIAASTIPCRQKPSFLPAAQSSGVLDSAEIAAGNFSQIK
jgi:hypothetical protein